MELKIKLQKLKKVAKEISKVDPLFSIQWVQVLLEIYEREGQSISNISEKTFLNLGTVTRAIDGLGTTPKFSNRRFGFVTIKRSPKDGRLREAYLTPKGKQFISDLIDALE